MALVPMPGKLKFDLDCLETAITFRPSTWALMLIGFAGLGFVGYRIPRKAVSIAA